MGLGNREQLVIESVLVGLHSLIFLPVVQVHEKFRKRTKGNHFLLWWSSLDTDKRPSEESHFQLLLLSNGL
jgi:hypothetical protein